MKESPLERKTEPKLYLVNAVILSIPIIESRIPMQPAIRPFTRFFPLIDAMIESPKNASANVSGALKLSESIASLLAMRIITVPEIIPPAKDDTVEIPSALAASPRSVIG